MTGRIRDGGGFQRVFVRSTVRDGGGFLRTIERARVRDSNNNLRMMFGAMSATASQGSVSGSASSNHVVPISTQQTTVSVTGGVAPYSFSWASSDSGWTATAPASAVTAFTKSAGPNTDYSTTFICTVTDAAGLTTTVSVAALVSNISYA